MCHALGLVDKVHGPFTLAGVETGNQCFCDSEKNPAYPLGTKREPETDCNTPCAGKASEMCGGGSRVEILRINCGSNWGWFFLLTVFLCTLGCTIVILSRFVALSVSLIQNASPLQTSAASRDTTTR